MAKDKEKCDLELELVASAQEEVAIEGELVPTARELLVAERQASAWDKAEEWRASLSEQAEAADIPEVNAESQKEFNKRLIQAMKGNLKNNQGSHGPSAEA